MPVSNLIPSAAAIAPAMAETGARIGNCRFRAVGGCVLFAEIRVHRQYFQPWIQLAQSFCGAFHTWLADPIVRHQDLSIQIVRPHIAGMGENQSADPRRRQIVADRPSQTATATDERSGTFQSLLSRLAEAGYLNLPRVRLALGIGEVVGNRHWRAID